MEVGVVRFQQGNSDVCWKSIDKRVYLEPKSISWTKLISENTKSGKAREALKIYKKMLEEGVRPNSYTFVAALKACSSVRDLETGKRIHDHVIETGNESQMHVANTLVDMYSKCGSILEARQVFDRIANRDVVSWNAMIVGYAHRDVGDLALEVYARMQHEGFLPDAQTFTGALKACASLTAKEKVVDGVKIGCLEKGRFIHSQVLSSGLESNKFVASALVGMYAKCGSMADARQVFDKIVHCDVVLWNVMILGYAHAEEGALALDLYTRMQQEGFSPNAQTFVAALRACSVLAGREGHEVHGKPAKEWSLEKGRAIHSQLSKHRLDTDKFVASSLIDMYAKCGSTLDARKVFDRLGHGDVVSWTAMIFGYANSEEGELALQLYSRMQWEGVVPNARTFIAALKACSNLAIKAESKGVDSPALKMQCLKEGRAIHSQATKTGLESDLYVASTLVDMYAKCGSMVDARRVFDRMEQRDVVSWTAMILGYAQSDESQVALQWYASMQNEGLVPNLRTFVAVLKACGNLAVQKGSKEVDLTHMNIIWLEKVRSIHSQVYTELDTVVASALIDAYVKCGSMVEAHMVFDRIESCDVVLWNTMILGYAQRKEGEMALHLYTNMLHKGYIPNARTFVGALKACTALAEQEETDLLAKMMCLEKGRHIHSQLSKTAFESDIYVANTLVDMYAKCGSIVDARLVFDRMSSHDLVSCNTMILAYAQSEDGHSALELYEFLQCKGLRPAVVTFIGALSACGNMADLEYGRKVHTEILKVGLDSDLIVATSLIDMYSKCASMAEANQLFDGMSARDLVTWNALIGGYSRLGDSEKVFMLFQRMQQENIRPNGITFVSLLTVCSHVGLVAKGRFYFEVISSEYGITPTIQHYSCMIDLLSRAGQLEEALVMVKMMPFKPDKVTWMTILGACRKWNNVVIGSECFDCIMRLDEHDPAPYVLMSNIYSAAGMWEDSAKIQTKRRNSSA